MPLVKPKDKEKRDDFIERCMGDKTSVQDFPKRGQRFAVCNSLYNARNKKEEYSMTDVEKMASAIGTLTDIIAKGDTSQKRKTKTKINLIMMMMIKWVMKKINQKVHIKTKMFLQPKMKLEKEQKKLVVQEYTHI